MQHVLFNQEYTKQIINALPGIKLSYSFLLENLHQIDCSCSDFFDYSSDELKAGNPVPYYILRGFSSKDEHFNYYSKNLELNKIHISDYNIIGKNGIRKFFKEYACGEFDSNNQLTSYSCLVQEDVHRNNLSSIYKSLRSLQIAVNNASLIAITDINGKITYANELLCKASQYTIDELIGETHQVFRSDYHDKAFFVELWKTILQGKIWRGEICNKAKDGSLFWVDTIISPILNKEEFVEYFISTSNIITEKKLLEMSLLEKNEKYKSIFENANDIIMVIDESYRFSSINTSFEKLTSLKKINYLNKSIFEVIHPDDEIPLKRAINRVKQNNSKLPVEVRIKSIGNGFSHFEVTITKFTLLNKDWFNIIARDISERKKNEKQIALMHESITVKTGLSFFSDLCQFFCRTLNVKYACIGRVSRKENTVYTLAFTEKDTIKDNFVFQIENTPTEKVINFEGFSYNGNVQDVFKKDKTLRDFSIASYLGFPIVDENSDPIGIVSLMNDKQIENTAYCEEILGLVFTRISNEISRINFENKLQESEAFNKGVLSSLNSEIAVLDKNGNILMVNDAWIKFGKENGKPGQRNVENHGVGSNYFEVCKKAIKNGDKDAKNVLDGVIKVADGRLGQFQYEFECSSPEEKRFFLMTANLFKGAESRVVLRYINITERKINESKLENSEKKYRLLVENSKELIFSMDKSGDISFANEAFFQALNLNASTKVNLFDFLHSRKTVITSLFSVNKERDSKELLQFELKTMDDTIVYLEGVIHVPIIENKVTEIQFYMTDRTQLRLAEIELQKSQKDYKTVVQNLNDAVVLKNKNSEILFFNTSYQKMIKEQDENNINKKNWFDFVADGWKYEIKKEYDDLYKSDIHDKTIEYEGLKSDNTSFWIEEKISTIMDESGNLIGTLSVIRDISEIKKQDLQLKKVVKDLNNRYNEMQQFNYIISHNLRAPISNILGLVNILSNQSTDDNELKIYIEYLKNSATKIDEVIKDLNLILNTKKSLDVERESVNIKLAIEGIIGIFQAQINTIKADIKFTITNEISKFYTIKSYFESIIYNLLSNAIKYRSNKRKLIITIDVFQKDNDLVIIVRDNGLGIDLEKNKHSLFGLYKRFNNSVEGKGLGLHMTKNQIEALGGTISVESQEDKGVTFTIQLPLKRINM